MIYLQIVVHCAIFICWETRTFVAIIVRDFHDLADVFVWYFNWNLQWYTIRHKWLKTIYTHNYLCTNFEFCVWPRYSFVGVCYIHWIWPCRIWLVILLLPQRVRGHNKWSLLFPDNYSLTWVFQVSVLSWVWHLFPTLLSLWTF